MWLSITIGNAIVTKPQGYHGSLSGTWLYISMYVSLEYRVSRGVVPARSHSLILVLKEDGKVSKLGAHSCYTKIEIRLISRGIVSGSGAGNPLDMNTYRIKQFS